nr:MAG TPA: hypothetical protein [Caudoviricetes sp.]
MWCMLSKQVNQLNQFNKETVYVYSQQIPKNR